MNKNLYIAGFVFGVFASLLSARGVLAATIVKNETRDVVGPYGAINGDSPYFPHTSIPHPDSGTSDGTIKTTEVDIYPGSGPGDFYEVTTVMLEMHDHDDYTVVEIRAHHIDDSWVSLASDYDVKTIGGSLLCGEDAVMYGLNRHPHDDQACYVNHTFTINAEVDQVLLIFACSQESDGCPRNDDVHVHIDDIIWTIPDDEPSSTPTTEPGTPTPTSVPPTPTSAITIACGNVFAECTSDDQCAAPGTCESYGGLMLCRNAACMADSDCNCTGPEDTPTPTPTSAVLYNAYCPI